MHDLSQDEKSKIYAVYLAIFELPFTTQRGRFFSLGD